jgi:sensor c-di-GMP phosphodiesterase-like protein
MFSLDEIEAGIKANEFFLEYLPTISLIDNRCVGAESLVRWQCGNRVVPPLEFIPLMENTPLSGMLTYWVVETVAQELGAWMRNHEGIRISINVPPEVLGRGGLRYAAEKSHMYDLAGKIMLEVTERGLPDSLGILIALDDVDMNEAHLVVLSRIHTNIIKLDKSFADQMLQQNSQPLEALAALVHSGDCTVIVEGIESALQAGIARDTGIQMAQGFYFSPPLRAAEFIDFFQCVNSVATMPAPGH